MWPEHEHHEDGGEDGDGLLDPPQVHPDEDDDHRGDESELEVQVLGGKDAEESVRPRRDGHGDRQDVVDDQRRPRDHPRLLPEELRRDDVPAAAGRERLDDLRVAAGDDQDRRHRHHRDEDGEHRVLPEGEVRLFRTVARGGDPVRAQPHPGEEGDEGDVMEDLRIEQVPGGAEQDPLHSPVEGIVFHRCRHLPGKEIRGRPKGGVYNGSGVEVIWEEGIRYSRTSRLCSPPSGR